MLSNTPPQKTKQNMVTLQGGEQVATAEEDRGRGCVAFAPSSATPTCHRSFLGTCSPHLRFSLRLWEAGHLLPKPGSRSSIP